MISKALEQIRRRLFLILGKAVITAINDDKGIQELQVSLLKGELKDKIPHFQNYGFTSHPHPGANGVAVFNGGDRNNGVVVAVDDRRFRLKGLKPGEVAIYTDEGDSITLKRGREIALNTKHFIVNADNYEINAKKSLTIETQDFKIKTKTFMISNGSSDIVSILLDWMTQTIEATTNTSLGPMKLLGLQFPAVREKLKQFEKQDI